MVPIIVAVTARRASATGSVMPARLRGALRQPTRCLFCSATSTVSLGQTASVVCVRTARTLGRPATVTTAFVRTATARPTRTSPGDHSFQCGPAGVLNTRRWVFFCHSTMSAWATQGRARSDGLCLSWNLTSGSLPGCALGPFPVDEQSVK